MLDKLKNIFGVGTKKTEPRPNSPSEGSPKPKKPRKQKEPKPELTAKDIATQNGEPYINITKVEIDPNNINNGAFELDWNDKFLLNLVRAGYKKSNEDTDNEIVDRWFQSVCRNIALEMYEQEMADPEKRRNDMVRVVSQRDLGNGRTEIS